MLGVGTAAQTAGTVYLYGLPVLIPALRVATGLPLWQLGLLVACPSLGMVLGVLGWGVLADRHGERLVVLCGLFGGGALLAAAAYSTGVTMAVFLVLAGVAGSALYASSGRIVVGWFPSGQRGLAMGIRQTSQPVGVALAAATLPFLAEAGGPRPALLACAALSIVVGLAASLLLADSPVAASGAARAAEPSPYRAATLWWLHGASALLITAQLAVATFAVDYLVSERHWPATTAGNLLAVAQLAAAAGRIAAGRWSDRVGSRLSPLRAISLAAAMLLGCLALAAASDSAAVVPLLLLAVVTTVSWHGIGYAAVAEAAPPSWSGRALSAQTLVQNVAATLTPPAAGLLIGLTGFAAGYATLALPPLAAAVSLHLLAHRQPAAPAAVRDDQSEGPRMGSHRL